MSFQFAWEFIFLMIDRLLVLTELQRHVRAQVYLRLTLHNFVQQSRVQSFRSLSEVWNLRLYLRNHEL